MTFVYKSQYVSDTLFLPTLVAAQMSTLFLIESIPASKRLRQFIRWTNIANTIWAVVALIILIVCGAVTHTWIYLPRAINLYTFWAVVSVLIIIIEVNTVVMPCICIAPMKASWGKKIEIMSSFTYRALVVAAVCVRLYYLYAVKPSDTDATYKLAGYVIASQVVLTLAITTASVPILSRFLEKFETGMLDIANVGNENSRGMSNGMSGMRAGSTNNNSLRQQKSGKRSNTQLIELGSRQSLTCEDTDIMVTTEFRVHSNSEAEEPELKDAIRVPHSFES